MEYYTDIKMNELSIHATTCLSFEKIMLSDYSQSSITRTDMIQFHSYEDPKREIYKDRKYISGCLGLRIRVGSWEAWVR